MKLIHLSDLHLGKRVNEFSMIEDQDYIMRQILAVIDDESPDAILIAGDVYDRSTPSAEAMALLDSFLCSLADRDIPVFLISGNHDSAERVAFGGKLMVHSGIHISPVYNGNVEPDVLKDSFGEVKIYMLPFLKPANVRRFFEDAEIESYTDALRAAVDAMHIDPTARNVLITHQFVTGASRSDSEEISIGGTDNVDASVFSDFDYVALGHIHGPQNIGSPAIRYCGTPLKYSFSEAGHQKSVTVAELGEKGSLNVRTVPLVPLRDLREIRGTYDHLTLRSTYEGTPVNDYLHITLTDEEDIPDAMARLRVIYPNLMKLDYDNTRTQTSGIVGTAENAEKKSPLELFSELYEKQNNQSMSKEQTDYMRLLIEEIWEGEA